MHVQTKMHVSTNSLKQSFLLKQHQLLKPRPPNTIPTSTHFKKKRERERNHTVGGFGDWVTHAQTNVHTLSRSHYRLNPDLITAEVSKNLPSQPQRIFSFPLSSRLRQRDSQWCVCSTTGTRLPSVTELNMTSDMKVSEG